MFSIATQVLTEEGNDILKCIPLVFHKPINNIVARIRPRPPALTGGLYQGDPPELGTQAG